MKKSRDVLILCQYFYPEFVARLVNDTARALHSSGLSVDVLCGYPSEYTDQTQVPKKETVDGVRVFRIKYLQLDRKRFLGRLVNYFSLTVAMFLRLFKMAKYRSIIVYTNPPVLPWVAYLAKKLFGNKLLFVAYDLYPEIAIRTNTLRQNSIVSRIMNFINRRVYRNADMVVALSKEMREYIVANRPVSPEAVRVIPNWYDDQPLTPATDCNPFRATAGERLTVSYFGNMGTAQDMDTILQAIRILRDDPDIFFLFAGHGNKMETLKATVAEEGLTNIQIHDFLHGQDFADALAASHCALVCLAKGLTGLCVPSKTYSYMMQGLPLLAIMDAGDIVDDVRSGAGLWVRNGEGEALAQAIRSLSRDRDTLQAMGRQCRKLYEEKYTTEICTGQYVDAIRHIIGKD